MRLGLSHLCDLKLEKLSEHTNIFFEYFVSDIETSTQYLDCCPAYRTKKVTVLIKIKNININILEEIDSVLSQIPPYRNFLFDYIADTFSINRPAQYILATKRF